MCLPGVVLIALPDATAPVHEVSWNGVPPLAQLQFASTTDRGCRRAVGRAADLDERCDGDVARRTRNPVVDRGSMRSGLTRSSSRHLRSSHRTGCNRTRRRLRTCRRNPRRQSHRRCSRRHRHRPLPEVAVGHLGRGVRGAAGRRPAGRRPIRCRRSCDRRREDCADDVSVVRLVGRAGAPAGPGRCPCAPPPVAGVSSPFEAP